MDLRKELRHLELHRHKRRDFQKAFFNLRIVQFVACHLVASKYQNAKYKWSKILV